MIRQIIRIRVELLKRMLEKKIYPVRISYPSGVKRDYLWRLNNTKEEERK